MKPWRFNKIMPKKTRIVSVIHYQDSINKNIRYFYVGKEKKNGHYLVKDLMTFSHMPLPHGQSRVSHTCELGSTSGIPTGAAARLCYTYRPCTPTVLVVLRFMLLHVPCQEILAPEESNWA